MTPLAYSTVYLRGLQRGYRMAGRSLFRRLFAHLLLASILYGTGIAFLWASADLFSRMSSGEPASIVVLNKWQSWFRVFPPARR